MTRLDRLGRSVLHLVTLGAQLRDRGGGACRGQARWLTARFSVKRVTAGNTGNPLPADGHPRPTVRLDSGFGPKHHALSWDGTPPTKCPGRRVRSCRNRADSPGRGVPAVVLAGVALEVPGVRHVARAGGVAETPHVDALVADRAVTLHDQIVCQGLPAHHPFSIKETTGAAGDCWLALFAVDGGPHADQRKGKENGGQRYRCHATHTPRRVCPRHRQRAQAHGRPIPRRGPRTVGKRGG